MIILIIPRPQKLIKRYTDTVQVQVLRRNKKEIRYFLKVAATRDFWHFFRISKSNTPWAPDKQTKVFGLAERFFPSSRLTDPSPTLQSLTGSPCYVLDVKVTGASGWEGGGGD